MPVTLQLLKIFLVTLKDILIETWFQKFCKCDWRVVIKQILKDVNSASQILAGLMKEFPVGPEIFHIPPTKVADQINLNIQFIFITKKKLS